MGSHYLETKYSHLGTSSKPYSSQHQNTINMNNRPLGSGQQYPVQGPYCVHCAAQPENPSTGGNVEMARPASLTHFNCHPTSICQQYHPHRIMVAWTCPAHRGALDEWGNCYYCQQEVLTNQYVSLQDLSYTCGYVKDAI